jgi:hypothetical protein
MGGDYVTASPVGEMLDEAAVCIGDDGHCECRCYTQSKAKVSVPLDCSECFRRSIGRGGKAISAQANPSQDRDEREFVKKGRIPNFLGMPEQTHSDAAPQSLLLVSLYHGISSPGN